MHNRTCSPETRQRLSMLSSIIACGRVTFVVKYWTQCSFPNLAVHLDRPGKPGGKFDRKFVLRDNIRVCQRMELRTFVGERLITNPASSTLIYDMPFNISNDIGCAYTSERCRVRTDDVLIQYSTIYIYCSSIRVRRDFGFRGYFIPRLPPR